MRNFDDSIPKLTDVITEDALRIFLEGLYRDKGLSVSLYADPGKNSPIFNETDCNNFCMQRRRWDNKCGCLKYNVENARELLLFDSPEALKRLLTCKFGLCHHAEVIRHRESGDPVAVIYFGGVTTDDKRFKEEYQAKGAEYCTEDGFAEKCEILRNHTLQIEDCYNAYIKLMIHAKEKTVISTYRGISGDLPEFLYIARQDIEKTFENILQLLASWTSSELTELLILDRHIRKDGTIKEFLSVRKVIGLTELEARVGRKFSLPVILNMEEAYIQGALKRENPEDPLPAFYRDNIDPEDLVWRECIRELKTRRILVLPLVIPERAESLGRPKPGSECIGCLVCYPRQEIWKSELPTYESFAIRTAITVYMATRSELFRTMRDFSRDLTSVATLSGRHYYNSMAKLIADCVKAKACSIFLLDPSSGYLRLAGTTDKGPKVDDAYGRNLYRPGQGITGFVAAQKYPTPYGEIVYDLASDPRKNTAFAEHTLSEDPQATHSLMASQIPGLGGEVLGVIRCVDAIQGSGSVFNSFNHFYLESLIFYARTFGMIYTLKERLQVNHEFILAFIHEFNHSLMGFRNNLELLRNQIISSATLSTLYKLDDARQIVDYILVPQIEDIKYATLAQIKPEKFLAGFNEAWFELVKDFLMPIKNALIEEARSERGIEIEFETPAVKIEVDKKRIMQVLFNVVRNAVKYSYDPTDYSIDKSSLRPIRIIGYRGRGGDRETFYIDVENNGIGIEEDEKEIVFAMYRKGRNSGAVSAGGLGLGLFAARYIMRAHGGDIFVKSCKHPTIITLRFPASRIKEV